MDQSKMSDKEYTKEQAIRRTMFYVSPPAVAVIAVVMAGLGFILGWFALDGNNEHSGIGILITLIFCFAVRWPVKAWRETLANQDPEKIEAMFEEYYTPPDDAFDEDDFDDKARKLLEKTVRKARKENRLVTGEELFVNIMKSVR